MKPLRSIWLFSNFHENQASTPNRVPNFVSVHSTQFFPKYFKNTPNLGLLMILSHFSVNFPLFSSLIHIRQVSEKKKYEVIDVHMYQLTSMYVII